MNKQQHMEYLRRIKTWPLARFSLPFQSYPHLIESDVSSGPDMPKKIANANRRQRGVIEWKLDLERIRYREVKCFYKFMEET
jgi:hypothetical protein